jgi:hypothetical protein
MIAKDILNALSTTRRASTGMLEYYYTAGVISNIDLQQYTDYLVKLNDELEHKLTAIFGVCEARLQTKGIK